VKIYIDGRRKWLLRFFMWLFPRMKVREIDIDGYGWEMSNDATP